MNLSTSIGHSSCPCPCSPPADLNPRSPAHCANKRSLICIVLLQRTKAGEQLSCAKRQPLWARPDREEHARAVSNGVSRLPALVQSSLENVQPWTGTGKTRWCGVLLWRRMPERDGVHKHSLNSWSSPQALRSLLVSLVVDWWS